MTDQQNNKIPHFYQIKIGGHLDKKWVDWFDGMKISYEKHATILTGYIVDQSALHGILNNIRDLNLTLISVDPIENKDE